MVEGHTNWTSMFFQIIFLIWSVCNTHGVASAASPSCTSDEYRAGQLCCLACPGGYRVHRDCTATFNTLCSKCPDDTFKEDLSGQKQCSACTECVTGQKVKKFCTPTSDTECETRDGFFCRSRVHRDCTATTNSSCSNGPDDTFKEDHSGQKQCSACTKCVTGQKVKKSCTPTSDTECETLDGFVCCEPADKDTFSEATLSCQPHTICDSVGGVQIQPGTDSTDSTCLKYVAIAFIIIGCICFIILLVLGALFYKWRKMEWDLTEYANRIREMKTPDQGEECTDLWEQLKEKAKTQKQQKKFNAFVQIYWEKKERLEQDRDLTELEKQIDEMETPEQRSECYHMKVRLRSRNKTQEQEKKLTELDGRYREKMESLKLDLELTEWEKQINEMETPDQGRECYTLRKRLQWKWKTPKQERKFDELVDRYNKKMGSMHSDWEFNEWYYRRSLKITQKWNKTSIEWIDRLLKKEEMTNTDYSHEKANLIREKQKKKQELDTDLTELIDELLEETKEQKRKITDGAAGEGTSGPSSTRLLSPELPAGLETSIPPAPSSETQPAGLETSIPPAPSSETQPAETTPLLSSESLAPTGDQQEHTSRTSTPDVTMDGHDDDQSLDALAYRSGSGQLDIEMGPVQTLPKDRNRIL